MSYATSSDQSQMMTQQPSPANMGAVPDLVKIGQIPTNTAIDIETDVLDPVVHSDKFCRFQFQNKGILHSNSKIVLRLSAKSDVGFLPVGVGIYSLIQRCALRVGTKTLCEIDDFNHYMGYKSMFLANEHQKQRETYTTGRRLAHKPYYYEDDGANDWGGDPDDLVNKAQRVGLDLGLQVASTRTQGLALNDHDFCKTNATYGPEFTLSLQDLFPFLSQNQLPLFMMTEPVTIELFFSTSTSDRLCLPSSGSATSPDFTIDQTATELIADYQYFPQEMMEQYAQQNKNLSFTFADYRLAKRTIDIPADNDTPATAVSTGQLIVNVGGAGRLVTKVFTTLSDDNANVKKNSILGQYHSMSLGRDLTNGTEASRYYGVLTSNVKYNDHFLYPVDVDNSAQQFHYLTQAEGMVPFINREEYNFEGQGITGGTFEGYGQKDDHHGIAGRFFYQAYKLSRNERINSRGIELYNTWDPLPNSKAGSDNSATLRTYLEIIRVAQLQDGKMEVFFA
jgi:hypothetical protein